MPEMLTINLAQPIAAVRIIRAADAGVNDCRAPQSVQERPGAAGAAIQADQHSPAEEREQQQTELARLCQTVGSIADGLRKLHEGLLANNHTEIAGLAIEIARKILMTKVAKGEYDIQAIVTEALKRAPTRQNIVIRLNPEDLPGCRKLQEEGPENPFTELELTADWSIGRGECLIETPKGIVKSFIEEHLERIGEALQKVE